MTQPHAIDYPAVLLAGGFGTRLRSALPDLPKPLAPVCGRPFITFLLDQLVSGGWTRAILCLHYKAEQIMNALGTQYRSLHLEYSVEPQPLGTGGAVRLALPLIRARRFLLLNADSFCGAPLAEFAAFHNSRKLPASLVSVHVPDSSRYGRLNIGPNNRVLSFVEKAEASGSGSVNAGIYLIETNLAQEIPPDRPVSLEQEIFPLWIPCGLSAWRTDSVFIDIGTPESYARVESYLDTHL